MTTKRKQQRRRRSSGHEGTIIGLGALALSAATFSRHMHSAEALFLGAGIGMILGIVIGVKAAHRPKSRESVRSRNTPGTEPRKTRLPLKNISAACAAGECTYCTDKGCQHCNHVERTYRERNKKPLYEIPDEPPF